MEKQVSQDPGCERFWVSNEGILTVFSALRTFIAVRKKDYPGNDLDLVYSLIADAAITFASAVSENGLPEEANRLLKRFGMEDLAEP